MSEEFSFIAMYEDMHSRIREFNSKNYTTIFEEFANKYGPEILKVTDKAKTMTDEKEAEELYTSIALQISSYVKQIVESYPQRQREKFSVDHNVTMVAYFLPVVTYYKLPECMKFGEIIVKVWNDNQTTTNVLSLSSYDAIAGGFKKSIFCYITTAVCDTLNKGDDCYELNLLRSYRDHYLAGIEGGRELIQEYYDIAPRLVLTINTYKDHEDVYKELYKDYILPCISCIEHEELEECKDLYVHMVRSLEEKYIAH